MTANLASEGNAKKINQRFRELEDEIINLKKELTTMSNAVGNMQNLINKQTEMIQQVFVLKYGNGPTKDE